MKKSVQFSRRLLALSLFLVLPSSCQNKVEQLDEHLTAGEYGEAAKLAEELCTDKVLDACYKLGEIYLVGKGVARDEKKGFDLCRCMKSTASSVSRLVR